MYAFHTMVYTSLWDDWCTKECFTQWCIRNTLLCISHLIDSRVYESSHTYAHRLPPPQPLISPLHTLVTPPLSCPGCRSNRILPCPEMRTDAHIYICLQTCTLTDPLLYIPTYMQIDRYVSIFMFLYADWQTHLYKYINICASTDTHAYKRT